MYNKLKKYLNISNLLGLIIIVLIYLVCRYRFFLGSNYCLNFDVGKTHGYDSGWFLNNVIDFHCFNINKQFTLIKNRSYMWFLLFAHYSNIDLRYFISLYTIIAGLFLFIMIYKITKNKTMSFLGFLYICLNPISFYSVQDINIYRNIIFIPSITILLSLYIIFYENLKNKKYVKTIITAVLLGISFVFMYLLTETGIVFLAIHLGMLLLFFIFSIFDCIKDATFKKKINIKNYIKLILLKLSIIIVPIFIGFMGIVCYQFVNYRVYGVYVTNMRTEGEIARFVSNVQDIDTDNTNTYIWCSQDQIEKAYNVSPTFQKYKKVYKHIKTDPIALANDGTKDIHGDFLGWAVTNAIALYLKDYQEAIKVFQCINIELEEAFKIGLLKKTNKIKFTKTLGRYSIDEINNEIIPLFIESFWIMINLKDLDKFVELSFNYSVDNTGVFFKFFNIKNDKEVINCSDSVKSIIDNYRSINSILYYMLIINIAISIFMFLIKSILSLFIKNNKILKNIKINIKYLLLSISFIGILLVYIFCISLFNIWVYRETANYAPLHCYYYGSMSIVFYIFAVIFSFLAYYHCFANMINKLILLIYNNLKTKKIFRV